MGVSSISTLSKMDQKSPADLRKIAEALYLKLHVDGFRPKQKVAVIAQMIAMVTESLENDLSVRR